jgi:hypothetical protein
MPTGQGWHARTAPAVQGLGWHCARSLAPRAGACCGGCYGGSPVPDWPWPPLPAGRADGDGNNVPVPDRVERGPLCSDLEGDYRARRPG